MNIAIIKYNAGNIQSVTYALNRLGLTPKVTDDINEIKSADKVIFPGVGEASSAMRYLRERQLDKLIISLKQPTLGICLGLQLMCSYSEENDTGCLGIFHEQVKKFPPKDKVPHMGWNTLETFKGPLFKGIDEKSYVYFVHSYYAATGADTISETDYNVRFSSGLFKNNFYALQFHPEKSGKAGAKILENFINL
jgi:imidazole glycerol-phosphate synthase subunit HisH